jgi:hypothetical protein
MAPPHAAVFIEGPDFSQAVPYELRNMHPFRYKVIARLIDYGHPTADSDPVPTGAYPDFCTFVSAPEGNVEVTDAVANEDIDITLYDNGGADDPCGKSTGICPLNGAGTLEVVLDLARAQSAIKPPDQLVFAILTAPAAFPTKFLIVPAATLAMKGFPYTVVINSVPPGPYIVYACYDVGGNSLMGCGPEDFSATIDDAMKLPIPAGKITSLRFDLDARTTMITAQDEPAARGCP